MKYTYKIELGWSNQPQSLKYKGLKRGIGSLFFWVKVSNDVSALSLEAAENIIKLDKIRY